MRGKWGYAASFQPIVVDLPQAVARKGAVGVVGGVNLYGFSGGWGV